VTVHQQTQTPQSIPVLVFGNRNELVGEARRGLAFPIDDDEMPALAAFGHEAADGIRRVAFQVPRVRGGRIAGPEDHQVGPVLHFAQRAGRFADFLQRHDRRPMPRAGGRVDTGSQTIRQRRRGPLAFGRAAAQPVDQRGLRFDQNRGGTLHGEVKRNGCPVRCAQHLRRGFGCKKPRLGQAAGAFDRRDAVALDRDRQVIAHAAAHRAGDIGMNRLHRVRIRCRLPVATISKLNLVE